MGQIREGALPLLFLIGQRLDPGGSLLLKCRYGFLRSRSLRLQQNVPEIYIILSVDLLFRLLLRQIISQLGKVHIRPV